MSASTIIHFIAVLAHHPNYLPLCGSADSYFLSMLYLFPAITLLTSPGLIGQLIRLSLTAFRLFALIELKALANSSVKPEGTPGNLTWAPGGRSFTIGDDKKFCETRHKAVITVHGLGTEVTSIRYLNSKLSIRNVFIYYGHMIIIISYNKARESNNYAFYMSAILSLSLRLLKYLAIIRLAWEYLAETMRSAHYDIKEVFFLDPNGRKKHL
ncbi:hypothetical protein FCULG_00011851 [Fusarium culmorum]|uniref:Uncharacterized protein n=1 Tax=Fusarium culmorum TaxID=5516 RepID=A0A2T4GS11_FUSCU|nr:hypothetical protein FCULG_00011851 [Fusarium culmorum]